MFLARPNPMRVAVLTLALPALYLCTVVSSCPAQAEASPSPPPEEDSAAFLFENEISGLRQASERGDPRALGIMSLLWQRAGNGSTDTAAAIRAARMSAAAESPFGQYALARLYFERVITKNQKEAASLGRKALAGLQRDAEKGDAWAAEFSDESFDPGQGISRDDRGAATRANSSSKEPTNVIAGLDLKKALRPETSPGRRRANLKVLFLGDSMSLCGFGKRLDERFRNDRRVLSVFSYMGCSTTPLSWIEKSPNRAAKTSCGFWTIESTTPARAPAEVKDLYGPGGKTPKEHTVPSVEKLLDTILPDILVMQTGTNLLGLFGKGQTVRPEEQTIMLRRQISPFLIATANSKAPLRRIYWIASPTSGQVSKAVQDLIFKEVQALAGPAVTVIDSRDLVSYPYREMKADKEHFVGADMDEWADKVFDLIQQDLIALSLLSKAGELPPPRTLITNETRSLEPPPPEIVELKGKLVLKSRPIPLRELLPYQESFVGYLYDVQEIFHGQYAQERMLVMHPAHIHLKNQSLDHFQLGNSYTLRVRELRGTSWETIKSRDESDAIDLQPYIRVEDDALLGEGTGKH
jgi:hypothetical protein